jgi:seryl-tRNA synthetase
MYDLSFFRSNIDAIATRLADRGFTLDVEAFRKLDSERRAALSGSEQLKAQKNAESQEIGKLKRAGLDASERQQKVREMDERMAALDQKAEALDGEFREMMVGVPNTPHPSVPTGTSAEDNVESGDGARLRNFPFRPKRIGIWGRSWESWISTARRRSRARASQCTWV